MNITKIVLIIVGLIVAIMGIMAIALPGFMGVTDPMWHAILKIVIGAVAIIVAFIDKKKQATPTAAPTA